MVVRFAVKIVDETDMSDWDAQALLREVDTLKAIEHPNIAKVYDVFYEKQCFGVTREKAERGGASPARREGRRPRARACAAGRRRARRRASP